MLNWVVIGVGDITTKRVMPAIQAEPRSRLYGVVSRNPDKARLWAPNVWTSLEEALADPAVEAVYVATPVALHAPQSITAMQAGRHVLCEKPLGMNYDEARKIAAVAAETGMQFGVAYYRRFYPKVRRALELLKAGAIGKPVLAEVCCHDWFAERDGFRVWLLDPAQAGGGPLYDTASHRIDLLNFLFGQPLRVSAHLSNAVHDWAVEDCATLLIEYEGGVRGVCDVRRHSRVARDELRIIGTEGELDLTPLNAATLVSPAGEEHLPTHPNLHYPLIENFVSAVLDGAPMISNGETARVTDAVTQAALESARNAAVVPSQH
jgi:predicted dehydrogenase